MYGLTNKYSRKVVAGLAGLTVGAVSAAALAATGPSAQSEQTTVSIVIPELVSITRLDDIDLGTWDPVLAGDEQGTDDLCVWSNDGASGAYQVTITSDTVGGGYFLDNAATTTTLPFTVDWANTSGQTFGTAIPYNTPVAFILSGPTTPNCGGGDNTSIIIDIAEADLAAQQANATAYDAVLTVEIAAVP